MTYEERVQQLKNYFAEARAYRDAVAAKEQVRTDARYMAMIPALDRKIPVVVSANGTSQINDAITWAKQENLRLIIRGGDDAIYVADRLKAENIPVILTSTMEAPNRDHEGYDAAYARAAQLYKAGVKFAISGGSGSLYTDRLPYEAGVAVAFAGRPDYPDDTRRRAHFRHVVGDGARGLELGGDVARVGGGPQRELAGPEPTRRLFRRRRPWWAGRRNPRDLRRARTTVEELLC